MKSDSQPHAVSALLERTGRRLAAARIEKAWTQKDLAKRIGVSQRTVVNIEAGNPGAAVGTVLHIAWLLNVRFDDAADRPVVERPLRRRASSRAKALKQPVDLNF
jgi:DNA-binding XRE family transcriptional regulator